MSLMSGWGNFPRVDAKIKRYQTTEELKNIISSGNCIAFGNLRSYGDAALGSSMIETKNHDYFIDFDEEVSTLHVQAGTLLKDIIDVFVPRGYFLEVVPGTQLITVGGAIASDVHGKNHHIAGCFSNSVIEMRVMNADGEVVRCSSSHNEDYFHATCGGMGLTGVILDAKIRLKKINSKNIEQTTIKTSNLKETFQAFEQHKDKPYSVAWIDCLAQNEDIGRSLLMYGDFSDDGELNYIPKKRISMPFNLPSFALNKYSVKAFNYLYYNRVQKRISHQKVSLESFFFPLDAIDKWNRIYGKNGFIQYQFILPYDSSYEGLSEILRLITESGQGSFLAVLKLYGPQNGNFLSFPIKGYSLALDFKVQKSLWALISKLDEAVKSHKGRLYMAKDAIADKSMYEDVYDLEKFKEFRKKNGLSETYTSNLSSRLNL